SVADLFDAKVLEQMGATASSAARGRVPVRLNMNLSGVLEKPTIGFTIQALELDPAIKSYVDQSLSLLRTNESELNKQVFGLLVMNRFLPTGSTGDVLTSGNYAGATAANTVSEFLSSQLSNYLGNLLDYSGNSALKNLDINIGYRQYDQLTTKADISTPAVDTRRELQLALQQRLLNNRLTINAGTNLDFGSAAQYDPNGQGGNSGNRSVIPTGDFQIQYALTPDGRWSAKAFNRTNYDYYNSRNTNRTGVGIAFRKEFDKPKELFTRKEKKPKKQKPEPLPIIPPVPQENKVEELK
ncbi:MAG TPA: translocation/assembly module TamB domain-containing protein, partial [Chitinophagales bacterium]|nr:translocation/assembly module TamB domain-containing protein [Chitinophagales bacterium]